MPGYPDPVARRRTGDPLVYLFARRSDGWAGHSMAFEAIEDLARSGFTVGAWTADEHGDYAPVTRVA